MYQALLTRKYLTSKIMPLLAMVAVLLSVATVLVTWSVMGGFLRTLLDSGRVLVGDVTISWRGAGFAHYDELIEDLEDDDLFVAATPVIEYFAQIQLPDGRPTEVYVKGVVPEGFDRVSGYMDHVWWRPLDEPTARDEHADDWRLAETRQQRLAGFLDNARTMTRDDSGAPRPAAILGIEVTGYNARTSAGIYLPYNPVRTLPDGTEEPIPVFMPSNGEIILTVLPPARGGGIVAEPVTRALPVANEFQSGIYEADKNTVLVPFRWLQDILNLEEARRAAPAASMFGTETDPETGEPIPAPAATDEVSPARTTSVIARARDGASADDIRARARQIYADFAARHPGDVPSPAAIEVATWEDLNATLVAAVKKETGLVLFIFGIVCFTTVFLVLAIFWAMINEKTRDIGILRALGASTSGVAGIWLSYGSALGLVGSALGVAAATLVVHNINAIHEWLGETFGLVVWDPRVYYFVEIPSDIVPLDAFIVFCAGILTCLLGAAIPAFRSARMDPVKSLRFE